MNYSVNDAEDFVISIKDTINTDKVDVVICPNYVSLDRIEKVLYGSNIHLGAQNVYYEPKGAYTGETSVDMLYAVNVKYCIVGHSERRQLFKETDEEVNKKVHILLEKGIKPIICVGETKEERDLNKMFDKVETQIKCALENVSLDDAMNNIVIAYEPIWAIGTGVTATSNQAEEMCKFIRTVIAKLYSNKVSDNIRIQYGGSVKPTNISELMSMENIDGVLVGGASLKNDFVAIVNYD